MSLSKEVRWRLKGGMDRRFKSGHPWVYSNELQDSPKGIEPGQAVTLQDAGGKFLARGYGNPGSLIAFRTMSRYETTQEPLGQEHLLKILQTAYKLRERTGMSRYSHRVIHGEADQFPGLIMDCYRTAKGASVYVIQAHTAGADRAMPEFLTALETFSGDAWENTAVILKNDVGMRKLEGLEEKAPEVVKEVKGLKLDAIKIQVASWNTFDAKSFVEFEVDLLGGQKTGFFLDQVDNIRRAAAQIAPENFKKKVRILDLCCYVGQWSTQLAKRYIDAGLEVEVVLFDASAKALDLAYKNVTAVGAKCEKIKGDILENLDQFERETFDLVISDPPALIKGRKDIPHGKHAYLQLNTQVFRVIKSRGAVVCCSCSALLEEEDFLQALSKAARRNDRRVSWVARGSQAADHPMLAEFPEGRYLKAWIGLISG